MKKTLLKLGIIIVDIVFILKGAYLFNASCTWINILGMVLLPTLIWINYKIFKK
jgi:hypothetical protein